jgi:hypothetical protein
MTTRPRHQGTYFVILISADILIPAAAARAAKAAEAARAAEAAERRRRREEGDLDELPGEHLPGVNYLNQFRLKENFTIENKISPKNCR